MDLKYPLLCRSKKYGGICNRLKDRKHDERKSIGTPSLDRPSYRNERAKSNRGRPHSGATVLNLAERAYSGPFRLRRGGPSGAAGPETSSCDRAGHAAEGGGWTYPGDLAWHWRATRTAPAWLLCRHAYPHNLGGAEGLARARPRPAAAGGRGRSDKPRLAALDVLS